MVKQFSKYTKNHLIAHLGGVNLVVQKLHFNKVVKEIQDGGFNSRDTILKALHNAKSSQFKANFLTAISIKWTGCILKV